MADLVIPSVTGGQTEYHPGGRITCKVKAGVTVRGGRLVELTGASGSDREVQEADANSTKVLGVAIHDGDGDNSDKDRITVVHIGAWPLVAVGSINAGDHIVAASQGRAQALAAADVASPVTDLSVESIIEATRAVVGIALEDETDGNTFPCLFQMGGIL